MLKIIDKKNIYNFTLNVLDQDQNVGLHLGPNCLQRLLSDDKSLLMQAELRMDKETSIAGEIQF